MNKVIDKKEKAAHSEEQQQPKSQYDKGSIARTEEIENQTENKDFIEVTITSHGNERVNINVIKLAEYVLKKITVIQTNRFFYYYDENKGVWRPNADKILRQEITEQLGEHYKSSLVSETITYIKNMTYENKDESPFNTNHYAFNFLNGMYDAKRNLFVPRHGQEFLSTVQIPVCYNPDATCPHFDKFIMDVLEPDDIPFLYEWIGYGLVMAYDYQYFLMLKGGGGNGKGTLLEILQKFYGYENVSNIPLKTLQDNRFASAHLYGKLVNICGDINDDFFENTDLIKQLTGDDMVYAEEKKEKGFMFKNPAKLMFSANRLPTFRDTTAGMMRRLLVLPMEKKFMLRKEVISQIDDRELSGILNKALKGLQRLLRNNAFTISKNMSAHIEDWKKKMDNVALFISEECEVHEQAYTQKQELFDGYERYCRDCRLKPIGRNKFYERLIELYPQIKDQQDHGTSRKRIFTGIKLR